MKSTTAAVIGIATLLAVAPLPAAFAQEAPQPDSPPAAPEGEDVTVAAEESSVNPFLPGDQTIALDAGVHLPLFILPGEATDGGTNLYLGGAFTFGFQYFVARGLAIGGTIGGAFNNTLGGRSLFVAPLSFRTAYWWTFLPFEFDVAAEVGGYLMRLGDYGMLGPFAKVGGGAYWRGTSAWSIGLQTYLWAVPELHTSAYADYNRVGGFLEVTASAVYHL